MATPTSDRPRLTLRQLRDAVYVGLSVFVVDFLTGLGAHGADYEHWSNVKHAVEAAITGILIALGYAGTVAAFAKPEPRPHLDEQHERLEPPPEEHPPAT